MSDFRIQQGLLKNTSFKFKCRLTAPSQSLRYLRTAPSQSPCGAWTAHSRSLCNGLHCDCGVTDNADKHYGIYVYVYMYISQELLLEYVLQYILYERRREYRKCGTGTPIYCSRTGIGAKHKVVY